jgi:hypothetical protein
MWVCGQSHGPAALPSGMTRYPLYRMLVRPVWTGAENLAPTRIRSPDRPGRIESLWRLSYPGSQQTGKLRTVKQVRASMCICTHAHIVKGTLCVFVVRYITIYTYAVSVGMTFYPRYQKETDNKCIPEIV